MIDQIDIEGFRGIERLTGARFGRFNVIIGKNDASKTALMEAIAVADMPFGALGVVAAMQRLRVGANGPSFGDFEGFWLPVFFNHDARKGVHLVAMKDGKETRVVVSQQAAPQPLSVNDQGLTAWSLQATASSGEQVIQSNVFAAGAENATFVQPAAETKTGFWIFPRADVTALALQQFSSLKQEGGDEEVVSLLREIEPRLSRIDILAPRGRAAIHVGIGSVTRMLPIAMMGQGFQRAFEMATCLAHAPTNILFIDEFENGLHHSVVRALWAWVARVALRRDIQIFATTHSEECLAAATAVFKDADKSAFRVVRIDRLEHGLELQTYEAGEVNSAGNLGVELRG